jgi:hypothetical protein
VTLYFLREGGLGGGFGFGAEQVPGFAVLFEAGAVASLGVEAEAFAGGEGFGGENVPDVERDDVGEEDVDVVDGVGGFSGLIGVDGIRGRARRRCT